MVTSLCFYKAKGEMKLEWSILKMNGNTPQLLNTFVVQYVYS